MCFWSPDRSLSRRYASFPPRTGNVGRKIVIEKTKGSPMATDDIQALDQQEDRDMGDTDASCQVVLILEGTPGASCTLRIEKGPKKGPEMLVTPVPFAPEPATVTSQPYQKAPTQMVQKTEAADLTVMPATPILSPAQA